MLKNSFQKHMLSQEPVSQENLDNFYSHEMGKTQQWKQFAKFFWFKESEKNVQSHQKLHSSSKKRKTFIGFPDSSKSQSLFTEIRWCRSAICNRLSCFSKIKIKWTQKLWSPGQIVCQINEGKFLTLLPSRISVFCVG